MISGKGPARSTGVSGVVGGDGSWAFREHCADGRSAILASARDFRRLDAQELVPMMQRRKEPSTNVMVVVVRSESDAGR